VPEPAGIVGETYRDAGRQPAVRGEVRGRLRHPGARRRRRRLGPSRGEVPGDSALRARREAAVGARLVRHRRRHSRSGPTTRPGPSGAWCGDAPGTGALMPAGISASDFYYILPELVLTAGAPLVVVLAVAF